MRVQDVRFIQLGSTGIWDGGPTLAPADEKKASSAWIDRHSPISTTNERATAEEELLKLHTAKEGTLTTVLNLCGLWGGGRSMRRYVSRIAGTKEQLKNKGSIHMIHGIDVARAILATSRAPPKVFGQRWLVTGAYACPRHARLGLTLLHPDLRVYDWWDLASRFGDGGVEGVGKPASGPQPQWVAELMMEENVEGLPRTAEELGRAMSSTDFWQAVSTCPVMGGQLD